MIKFVIDFQQVGGWFSPDTAVSSVNKTDRHDVTEILLKVAFNTITQTKQNHLKKYVVFAGDENTYVNDLLEDIIVICKYGMKYNSEFRRTFKKLKKRIEIVSKSHCTFSHHYISDVFVNRFG